MMFRCISCGRHFQEFRYRCEACGGSLLHLPEDTMWEPDGSGVWRYRSMIGVIPTVSLGEGNTPLVRRRDVQQKVYMKLEGDNPTGSFKDRGTSVVMSDALNKGHRVVTVASTGNMGASVAAYAAYANIKARIFIPEGIPEGKIAQMRAYGAELIEVKGGFSNSVQRSLREVEKGAYLASTGLNPYFIEGLKTVGFEIFEQMGFPDAVVVPTGTGGLLTALHKGFVELKGQGIIGRLPRMVAVQAEGHSPIVRAWRTDGIVRPMEGGDTIASAIKVKEPYNGESAIRAMRETSGEGITVTDPEIIEAVKELGREGVFAEPSSAAALAGLKKMKYGSDERIVLIITGSGLKDPEVFESYEARGK